MNAKATQTVSLSSKELEGAIEVLSSAQELQLSRFERFAYRTLMVSVDVAILSFVAMFFSSPDSDPWPGEGILVNVVGNGPVLVTLFIISSIVLAVSTFIAIVSLVLNFRLLRKTFRESARLKQLGLSSLSKSLWKESRRSRRTSRARSALLFFICILVALEVVKRFILNLPGDEPLEPTLLVIFLGFLATGVATLLSAQYLRNQRERMDLTVSAEELRKALESLRRRAGSAGVVSVPAELLKQTAKIESTQIAKERKDAILESVAFRPTGYTIAFDRDAAKQRATLGVADRIELEDLVAHLSTDGAQFEPQAGGAAGAKGVTLRATTQSKRIEIEYVIDYASRGICVTVVQHKTQGSHTSLNGASHA